MEDSPAVVVRDVPAGAIAPGARGVHPHLQERGVHGRAHGDCSVDDTVFLSDAVGFCNDAWRRRAGGVRSGLRGAEVRAPWGPYPGHSPEDIGSGTVQVHNSSMYVGAEKSVVRGP
eukprot:CAMPEP_0194337064 /NCGR_PEP_ID=MMETSP0171-20130528/75107_1 /TAXON_ID=218684 /ORGANISM="Corethron pennatum, Strain L29A3" /LENGTH=115 /DNA_ID=CAMNT_0039100713 /DNA_START=114 /DNA_END=462 /DNA_ORIENTATION=-